jgi:hypothetical protein
MTRVLTLAGGVAGLLLLCAACGLTAGPGQPAVPPTGSIGPLTTQGPVYVIDDGSGAELCLTFVLTSHPPQCDGPKAAGWKWTGTFEKSRGTRWGEYIVIGYYDPDSAQFTATEVRSGEGYVWPHSEDDIWTSACPEPAGGWRVTDTSKVSTRDYKAAMSLAESLPDYSAVWEDQSPNPALGKGLAPEDQERLLNDPLYTVINLAVAGDVAAAEAKLREVWSGMLCVSRSKRTEAELLAVQDQLNGEVKGFLGCIPDPRAGVLRVQVPYDDGSVQRSVDKKFGKGLIVVESVLEPA